MVVALQIGEAATENEIFRFVYRSFRAMERNAYAEKAGHCGTPTGPGSTAADVPSSAAHSDHAHAPLPVEVDLMKVKRIEFEHLEQAVER